MAAKRKTKEQKLQAMLKTPPVPPKLEDFMSVVVQAFGGMEALAMRLKQELDEAPVGSQLSKQWASLVLNGLKAMNETGRATDLGALSDEDIDLEVKRQIAELKIMQEPEEDDSGAA